jgi:cell division transport system permease protein
MFTLFKRIFRASWLNFRRNIGLSLATIFILLITISLITYLFLFRQISQFLIAELEAKIDISVYFKEDSPEEEILKAEDELSKMSEVKEIEYISQEMAREKFIQKHKDNPLLMASLEEIGENPFLASLNIKAQKPEQYETLANFLENSDFKNYIEEPIDYYQRKPIIDKLSSITSVINKAGIGISIILVAISFLVAFNTIRLAIFNQREEISIMRLVGASNWFIRAPFLIQGIISGFFATLITVLIFFLICWGLGPKLEIFLPGFNLQNFFFQNFWILFSIQLLTGMGLSILSSFIALRRYLKV